MDSGQEERQRSLNLNRNQNTMTPVIVTLIVFSIAIAILFAPIWLKKLLTIGLACICTALFATAEEAKPAKSLLDGISIETVGAYHTADFLKGNSSWDAGLQLDLPVNKFVSIAGRALMSQDNPG